MHRVITAPVGVLKRVYLRYAPIVGGLCLGACASVPAEIALPSGRSTPIRDHAAMWHAAAMPCRAVHSMDLMVVFGGRLGDTRLRRTRMRTALAAPDFLRLEGLAPFGAPAFLVVAQSARATLVLPRDRQVIPDVATSDLLYTLAGLALEPADVRALLTGCVVPSGVSVAARAYGDDWVAIDLDGGATVYLRTFAEGRRIAAGRTGGLTVAYTAHVQGLPRQLRIQTGSAPVHADLTVELSQVNINTELLPATFTIEVPMSFAPITIDDLRRTSPTEGRSPGSVTGP